MKKQMLAVAVVGALALGVTGVLAWSGGAVSVDVPFSFIVKDKVMPAGRYEIRARDNDETSLEVRSSESGEVVFALVLERLADSGTGESKVVFDKTEDGKTYLSEVHVPGSDGFLVGIAGGKEKHVTLIAKK